MTKEAIFAGFAFIRKEVDVLQQNLALRDSSSVAFRLRNVVDHVVVGGHMYSRTKGLSCDLPLNIPHKIFHATSEAAQWRAVQDWSSKLASKIEGKNGQYKLVTQIREIIAELRERAARGVRELELRRSVPSQFAKDLLRTLEKAVSEFKELLTKTLTEVDKAIESSKEEAETIVKSLNKDRKRMLTMSDSERALSSSAHFEEILELASYGPIKITSNGGTFYEGIYCIDGDIASWSDEIAPSGHITGLKRFRKGLEKLQNDTEKCMDPTTLSALRGEKLIIGDGDLTAQHLKNEISAYEAVEVYLDGFMAFAANAKLKSEQAEEALELAKKERYEALALSDAEFNARMEDLNEQKSLLLRVLAFLVGFNKEITRINIS
jgi:hypothetical protein